MVEGNKHTHTHARAATNMTFKRIKFALIIPDILIRANQI